MRPAAGRWARTRPADMAGPPPLTVRPGRIHPGAVVTVWLVGWLLTRLCRLVWLGLRGGWHLLGLLVLGVWDLGVWLIATVLDRQQPAQPDPSDAAAASAPVIPDAVDPAAKQATTVQLTPTQH